MILKSVFLLTKKGNLKLNNNKTNLFLLLYQTLKSKMFPNQKTKRRTKKINKKKKSIYKSTYKKKQRKDHNNNNTNNISILQ